MDRQEAMEFLLDHYEHPRNKGKLENPTVSFSGGNPGCGDLLEFQASFDENGRVASVAWDGEGCTISSAAASYVSELIQGKTAEEIEAISFENLIDDLGRELVMTRPTCATLALSTIKRGVHDHEIKQRYSIEASNA